MYKKGLENYKDLIKIFILLIVYLLLDKINKLKLNNYWIIIATSTVFLRINAGHLFLNLKASLGVFSRQVHVYHHAVTTTYTIYIKLKLLK